MNAEEILANTMLSINFLISLLKKHWQNVKSLNLKVNFQFYEYRLLCDFCTDSFVLLALVVDGQAPTSL